MMTIFYIEKSRIIMIRHTQWDTTLKCFTWPPVYIDSFTGNDQIEGDGNELPFISTDTFLLTHVHRDRLIGLDPTWDRGVIICSDVSAKIIYRKYQLGGNRVVSSDERNYTCTVVLLGDF
jgi:hypothetical protein